jgi:hypothetical protein
VKRTWPTDDAAHRAALARAAAGQLLGPSDIGAIFGIGPSQFHHRNALGHFDRLKVTTPIGPRCFSGLRVYRFVNGDDAVPSAFGQKRRAG